MNKAVSSGDLDSHRLIREHILEHRLFYLRAEMRKRVLQEAHGDQLSAERIFSDLMSPRRFGDCELLAHRWHLASGMVAQLVNITRELDTTADLVWSAFQGIFFGRGSLCYAEVVARRLLFTLAGFFDANDYSRPMERMLITALIRTRNQEQLPTMSRYGLAGEELSKVLSDIPGFKRNGGDEPSHLQQQIWSSFRRLLQRHRSIVYSTSFIGGI